MYVESITMRNFRCFENARTTFGTPPRKEFSTLLKKRRRTMAALSDFGFTAPSEHALTAILGDNGAGKSTVLRGIALSVLWSIIGQSGYVARHLTRRGEEDRPTIVGATAFLEHQDARLPGGPVVDSGTVEIHRRHSTEILKQGQGDAENLIGATFTPEFWDGLYEEEAPSLFLAAYGATRSVDTSEAFDPVARRKLRTLRYQRVAGIFEDHITLAPLHLWLARESEAVVQAVTKRLNAALPGEIDFTGRIENASAIFTFRGAELPFEALSDGYRGFIGLVGDLLYHLVTVAEGAELTSLSGVVLIDELDLHLHPTWQRTVAQRLTSAFPRLQFIVTTHSPLIVGTLEREQIRVLDVEEVEGGYPRATIRIPAEDVHGLNVDDVLLSSYFGLRSTRSPDAKRRERDLLLDAAGGDVQAARELLNKIAAQGRP